MKTPIVALALAAFAAQSAGAQIPSASDGAFTGSARSIFAAAGTAGKALKKKAAARKNDPARLMASVLTAMNDQPGTGELIAGWLRERKAEVAFSDFVSEKAIHAVLIDANTGARTPAVFVNSKYASAPVSYRYIGVLVARETAELMLADFPDSAEKIYIKTARAAEVYFELGGTRLGLPGFDGVNDPEVAAELSLWIENDPAGGVAELEARGEETLEGRLTAVEKRIAGLRKQKDEGNDVESALAGAEAQRASIVSAKKIFRDFKAYEKDWLMAHQGQLQ